MKIKKHVRNPPPGVYGILSSKVLTTHCGNTGPGLGWEKCPKAWVVKWEIHGNPGKSVSDVQTLGRIWLVG